MVFTHLCRAVAVLAALLGVLQVVLGLTIASGVLSPYDAALARYTTESSSGKVIDKGFLAIVAAIVLGTLAEISFSVRKSG